MDRTRFADVSIPEKKKSEIAKKKMGRGDFCGSVGAQQTYKILRVALVLQS